MIERRCEVDIGEIPRSNISARKAIMNEYSYFLQLSPLLKENVGKFPKPGHGSIFLHY
jgi:hypothetical protein